MHITPDRLAICSWSVHPKNPADLIDQLKQIGLAKVQLALAPLRQDPKVWGDTPALLAKAGITVVSGMFGTVGEDYTSLETIKKTGGVVPDQHWPENWKIVQETCRIATQMKLKQVSTHAGFLPHEESDPSFAKLVDRIGQIAGLFAKSGITLLFETGQEDADTLNLFLDAMEKRGHRNIAVNFDPANMILYDKGEPVSALRKLMKRVAQVHIKDAIKTAVPGTWGKEVAIGEGQVNWKGFLQVLEEARFPHYLVIEREAGDQRIPDIRKAIAFLTQTMKA
jgi:sugar phosphate isomerase/epimerase